MSRLRVTILASIVLALLLAVCVGPNRSRRRHCGPTGRSTHSGTGCHSGTRAGPSSHQFPEPAATSEAAITVSDWGGREAKCAALTISSIGYSPLTMEFDYFQFIEKGMKEIADQCKLKVLMVDPKVDATKQVSDVENMVAGGVGAVAIYSVDPKAILTAVDTAHKAGAKVVAAVSAFDDADAYVGISDYDFGFLQGKQAGPLLLERKPGKEKYKVAVLNADSLGPNLLDRKKGLIEGLKTTVQNFEVVADVEAWAEDKGLDAVETILQAHPDLDLILTVNDPGLLGAASAVQAARKDLKTETIVMGMGIDKRAACRASSTASSPALSARTHRHRARPRQREHGTLAGHGAG